MSLKNPNCGAGAFDCAERGLQFCRGFIFINNMHERYMSGSKLLIDHIALKQSCISVTSESREYLKQSYAAGFVGADKTGCFIADI